MNIKYTIQFLQSIKDILDGANLFFIAISASSHKNRPILYFDKWQGSLKCTTA